MLKPDGRTCKCGGVFTEASGSFSTPFWPARYPNENFDCEWTISLPNNDATIQFSIDDTAYGINGRSPCPTDFVQFFDGVSDNADSLYKLCKFDRPSEPIVTSTSEARVVFKGSQASNRPASRVGVMVHYRTVTPITASSQTTTTTATTNPPTTSAATTNPPTTAGTTNPTQTAAAAVTTPPPVNECLVRNGGCQHECTDTPTSYYCSCRPGYSLDDNQRTCSIDCGGELTGTSGSFQTPDFPQRYPQADFTCVWSIRRPESSQRIRFTIDGEHFGINGRSPCRDDYLRFYRGSGQSNPVGDKICFLRPPTEPIEITSTEATIVFSGSYNLNRPASRVGVKVHYEIVNE